MEYLLDTNICIYLIKKKPEQVFQKFSALAIGSVGVSTITVAELEYGVAKSSNPAKNAVALETFLTPIEIVEFDFRAAEIYGTIRTQLEKAGTPIGPYDLLIASQAISMNIPLVTNNVKEFSRVPMLTVENWV
ncbi:MAG: type II toxin-antitoxin system VapC family toxin [Candidatus Kapabacteria bacterium]|nr:type II toxin-antitoxin system VapC family toxin [Candidatus Kapabacteria bacterium]MBX7156059.1 type II toxin-antitoxin system VapC family toxin [Bacteroidota bacterium]